MHNTEKKLKMPNAVVLQYFFTNVTKIIEISLQKSCICRVNMTSLLLSEVKYTTAPLYDFFISVGKKYSSYLEKDHHKTHK